MICCTGTEHTTNRAVLFLTLLLCCNFRFLMTKTVIYSISSIVLWTCFILCNSTVYNITHLLSALSCWHILNPNLILTMILKMFQYFMLTLDNNLMFVLLQGVMEMVISGAGAFRHVAEILQEIHQGNEIFLTPPNYWKSYQLLWKIELCLINV